MLLQCKPTNRKASQTSRDGRPGACIQWCGAFDRAMISSFIVAHQQWISKYMHEIMMLKMKCETGRVLAFLEHAPAGAIHYAASAASLHPQWSAQPARLMHRMAISGLLLICHCCSGPTHFGIWRFLNYTVATCHGPGR